MGKIRYYELLLSEKFSKKRDCKCHGLPIFSLFKNGQPARCVNGLAFYILLWCFGR